MWDDLKNEVENFRRESGQVVSEYAIMMTMFIMVAVILLLLMAVFTEYGWRLVQLVALPYP